MCDYSLSGIPNRLAVEGERLVAYRFPNGVKGFVSQPDLAAFTASHPTLWTRICAWFRNETPCAVCLPPGATLLLRDLPGWLRAGFRGDTDEIVTFVQGESREFRDGIQFRWGGTALLQQLPTGQVADVLSLSSVKKVALTREAASRSMPASPR
jgi:hypothetical protein